MALRVGLQHEDLFVVQARRGIQGRLGGMDI